jgi:hypothetical protein
MINCSRLCMKRKLAITIPFCHFHRNPVMDLLIRSSAIDALDEDENSRVDSFGTRPVGYRDRGGGQFERQRYKPIQGITETMIR